MSKVTLLQKYEEPIFIASQSEGQVYKISDKYVVKVPTRERYKEDMFHEIKIARLLYSLGFPVPEPITIDYVNVRDNKVELGYIMEYIDGISWDDQSMSGEGKKEFFQNLFDKEINQIISLYEKKIKEILLS